MPEDEISTHGVSHLRSVQRDIQHMAEDDLSQPFSTPAQLAVQSYRTCVRSRLARTRMCDQAASGDDWISEKRLARLRRSNGECLCTVHRLANVPATAVPRRPWLRHGHVCVLWSGVARCGVVWRGVAWRGVAVVRSCVRAGGVFVRVRHLCVAWQVYVRVCACAYVCAHVYVLACAHACVHACVLAGGASVQGARGVEGGCAGRV